MKIEDWSRGTEITISESVDTDQQVEVLGTSDRGDSVWFYMNKEQAQQVIDHLTAIFQLEEGK